MPRDLSVALRTGSLLDSLSQDLRFGLRQIVRWPGFSLLVVVAVAVGIGTNVAIFSVLKGVVLRPLPYQRPERLVAVWETPPGRRSYQPFSSPDYFDVREQSQALEEIEIILDQAKGLSKADLEALLNSLGIDLG